MLPKILPPSLLHQQLKPSLRQPISLLQCSGTLSWACVCMCVLPVATVIESFREQIQSIIILWKVLPRKKKILYETKKAT